MKRYLALLLSVVMVITFMPTMALTAYADDEPEIDTNPDNYELQMYVNGVSNNVNIAPGEGVTFEAKLFHHFSVNDRDVVKEVKSDAFSFELLVEENVMFDGHEQEDDHASIFEITSTTDQEKDDEKYESTNGIWTLSSYADTDEDGVLYSGSGIFRVSLDYQEMHFETDWSREIGVGCRIDYGNTMIFAGNEAIDNSSLEAVLPGMEDSDTIDIDPVCDTDKVTSFEFEIGGYDNYTDDNGDEQWNFKAYDDVGEVVEGTGTDAMLQLSKAQMLSVTKYTDPGFVVSVTAKGKASIDGQEKEVIYARNYIDVLIDDGRGDVFQDYHIECPSAIKYEKGKKEYDVLDQFKLVSNSDDTTLSAEDNNENFDWRFVQINPDLIPIDAEETEEGGALIEESNILDDGKLTMDHLGKYWVVVAGQDEYRGFIIDSFELTDSADYFYTSKPHTREGQVYTGEALQLVSQGVASEGGTVKYSLNGGDFTYTEPPTATDPGDYTVSFRVVDGENNVVIPAETLSVRVDKAPINIVLQSATKEYGQPDPEFTINKTKSSTNIGDIEDQIRFSREIGEDVNGTGYRIFAHYEDDNYVARVQNSRLKITKTDYNIAVQDKISFDLDSGSCILPYECDGDNVKVLLENDSELHATVNDGYITLEATGNEAFNETIKLEVAADRNHKTTTSHEIAVCVTTNIDSNEHGAVSAAEGNETSLDDLQLEVNYDAEGEEVKQIALAEAEDRVESAEVEIKLMKDDTEFEDYGANTKIVVKVKLEGDLGTLVEGTEPKAICEDETLDAWFETIDGEDYICFETAHLSNWKFSVIPPIDLEKCDFDLQKSVVRSIRYQDEDSIEYDVNLGTDILKNGETPVDSGCYNLKFAKVNYSWQNPREYNLDEITGTGLYKIKAEAVIGKGYTGEKFYKGTLSVKDHKFSTSWSKNQYAHWHECADSNCDVVSDEGLHNFESRPVKNNLVSAATCSEYAKYYKVCKCGATSKETFSDTDSRLKKHDLEFIENEDESYWRCKECGAIVSTKEKGKEDLQNLIIAGVAIVGATIATVAIVKTVDTLVQKAKEAERAAEEAARKAEEEKARQEAEKLLEEAKTTAKEALGEALGESTNPVVGAYFDEGFETVAAAKTPDEVLEATVKYVNLINEAKTVVETKIKLNKPTAQKNGKIRVTFENPGLDGVVSYHVERSNKKDFSKNLKTRKVKAKDKDTLVYYNTKNLKKGTKYYYQVYAKVKLSDGNIVETDLSNVRSAKCKKTR